MTVARATIKAGNIGRFIAAAFNRRVDCGLIGDSNLKQAVVTGHAQGLLYAWSMLGVWSTGISPAHGAANNWGAAAGDVLAGSALGLGAGGGATRFDTAPDDFRAALLDPGYASGFPDCADYITNWAANNAGSNGPQLSIRSQHPLNMTGALEYQARVYRPVAGAATQLYPCIQTDLSGGVGLGIVFPPAAIAAPLASAPGFSTFKWTIPAGQTVNAATGLNASGDGTGFRIRQQRYDAGNGNPITGSFGLLYQCLTDPNAFTGVRFGTFGGLGGEPTRTMANKICTVCSDTALAEYMRFLAAGQVDAYGRQLPPMWLLQIVEGGNDSGDATSSVVLRKGAGFGEASLTGNAAGSTKQGYKNNTQAIINRLTDVWTRVCGFDPRNLFFVIGSYHPQPVEPQKTFVRTTMVSAMRELCDENENVAGIDGWQLKTPDNLTDLFMTANYDAAGVGSPVPYVANVNETGYRKAEAPNQDTAHLHERCYQEWGRLCVGALIAGVAASGLMQSATGASSSEVQYSR